MSKYQVNNVLFELQEITSLSLDRVNNSSNDHSSNGGSSNEDTPENVMKKNQSCSFVYFLKE